MRKRLDGRLFQRIKGHRPMQTTYDFAAAYRHGFRAGADGISRDACPFDNLSENPDEVSAWDQWQDGYDAGKEAF